MKRIRKIVDERQDLEMLRVERGSFWVLFFGLAIVITAQVFVFDSGFEQVAGECIVLAVGAVWSLIGYIRRGSWDYFSKPGYKSYLVYSAVGALVFALAIPISRYFRFRAPLLECLVLFLVNFLFLFALLFVSMLVLGSVTKWRQKRLQRKYEEEA